MSTIIFENLFDLGKDISVDSGDIHLIPTLKGGWPSKVVSCPCTGHDHPIVKYRFFSFEKGVFESFYTSDDEYIYWAQNQGADGWFELHKWKEDYVAFPIADLDPIELTEISMITDIYVLTDDDIVHYKLQQFQLSLGEPHLIFPDWYEDSSRFLLLVNGETGLSESSSDQTSLVKYIVHQRTSNKFDLLSIKDYDPETYILPTFRENLSKKFYRKGTKVDSDTWCIALSKFNKDKIEVRNIFGFSSTEEGVRVIAVIWK